MSALYPKCGISATHKRDVNARRIVPDMGISFETALGQVVSRYCDGNPAIDTVKKLASASALSTGTADRVRKGQVAIGVDKLPGLARALGISVTELIRQSEVLMLESAPKSRRHHVPPPLQIAEPSPDWVEDMNAWMARLSPRQQGFLMRIRTLVPVVPDSVLDSIEHLLYSRISNPDHREGQKPSTEK